jgi:nicotinamide-nucleotide amidase
MRNDRGTAPGMIFREKGKFLFSMPGVPFEMKNMVSKTVIPMVLKMKISVTKVHRHIKTFGIAEADLAEQLKSVTKKLPSSVKMAFLPSPGHVKIRLSVRHENEELAHELILKEEKKILDIIGTGCYGFDNDSLEVTVGKKLTELGKNVATAESCTGGLLASRITSVSGASNYYKGSVIAYSNQVKMNQLGVSQTDLDTHGAVSDKVVCQMAVGVRKLLNSDYGLATSGIAGPEGGTEEKPVGTIWIAIADDSGVKSIKLKLGFNRALNISLTTDHVLNFLRKELNNSLD